MLVGVSSKARETGRGTSNAKVVCAVFPDGSTCAVMVTSPGWVVRACTSRLDCSPRGMMTIKDPLASRMFRPEWTKTHGGLLSMRTCVADALTWSRATTNGDKLFPFAGTGRTPVITISAFGLLAAQTCGKENPADAFET